MVISIFSISLINDNAIDSKKVSAEEKMDEGVNKESKNGDSSVTNQIENNINGDQAEVNNSITNNVENGENNQVDNQISNNIQVNVDVNISNDVENNVKGDKSSTNKDNHGNTNDSQENDDGKDNDNGKGNNGEQTPDGTKSGNDEVVWGVDSASLTTSEMLACVKENFGTPEVWGRYLGEKNGVSAGITSDEIKLLHDQEIKILVIWNHFTDATGSENGKQQAEEAIQQAQELGIPEGVAIFADIEPNYPVDSEFIRGWYEAMNESEYIPGIYGIFNPERDLYQEYEKAAAENPEILDNVYLWTASPNTGITSKENAPEYQPEVPENSLIAGWQYGIDAETCNIDTNLFSGNVIDVLW